MHMSLLLMEQILELFLMILMGFIIVKAGIVTDEDSKVLSKIVLYLIIPCVIINAFQVNYTPETVHGLLIAFIASVMLQILLLIIVSFMGKPFCLNEVEIASSQQPPVQLVVCYKPSKGLCYCSPQRAVSQAFLLVRYKAVLLESSFLDSSACSFIYFCTASSVILPIVST